MIKSNKKKVNIEGALDKFQIDKRDRMRYILEELERREGEADLNEFMGSIAVNYGIRTNTQKEYFREMEYAGVISVHNGKIKLIK